MSKPPCHAIGFAQGYSFWEELKSAGCDYGIEYKTLVLLWEQGFNVRKRGLYPHEERELAQLLKMNFDGAFAVMSVIDSMKKKLQRNPTRQILFQVSALNRLPNGEWRTVDQLLTKELVALIKERLGLSVEEDAVEKARKRILAEDDALDAELHRRFWRSVDSPTKNAEMSDSTNRLTSSAYRKIMAHEETDKAATAKRGAQKKHRNGHPPGNGHGKSRVRQTPQARQRAG